MNFTEFIRFTKKSTRRRHTLMMMKNRSYAGGSDCLGNFKRRAEELGISLETVIKSDMSKHWDQINNGNIAADTTEGIASRFDDFCNYTDLLRAAFEERMTQKPTP